MRNLLIAVGLLAVVAASVGAYYTHERPEEEIQYSYLRVTRGDVVDVVGATGTLQPVRTVAVGSQVSGNIKALYADFNSIVRQGQVVAELDPSLYQSQVEQARANLTRSETDRDRQRVALEQARATFERIRSLFNRKIATQQEFETARVGVRLAEASLKSAEAAIVQARASLGQAEVSLGQTVIRAPADGIITSRSVDVGQTVAARLNAPTIFVIADDLAKMQVVANVDESDVGQVRPGQVARFRVDAYPGDTFIGTVSQVRLNPIVSQNVVTYATVIDVPNPRLQLKFGMTAYVTIEIARKANVLRVPNGALHYRPEADIFTELRQPVPPDLEQATPEPAAPLDTPAAADDVQPAGEAMHVRGSGSAASHRTAARTIDQLFGPPDPMETDGRVWLNAGGQLKSVRLRLGITDGMWTELLGHELADGQSLVSSIVTPAMLAAAASRRAAASPWNSQRRTTNPFQMGGGGHRFR